MKKTYICFLDKPSPPNHSFVNGFLADLLSRDCRVLLVVEGGGDTKPFVYRNAVVLPLLNKRSGVGRAFNIFKVMFYVFKFAKRFDDVDLFVRNDPFYLLGAVLSKRKSRVVYQNSFPHEYSSGKSFYLKGFVAKVTLKYCLPRSDYLITVTARGRQRLGAYAKLPPQHLVIPLKTDFQIEMSEKEVSRLISCVYVGSHSGARRLSYILESISDLDDLYLHRLRFHFYGGHEKEIAALLMNLGVQKLVAAGCLTFHPAIPRDQVEDVLKLHDVGISIIPPTPNYLESSPTKLNEYLAKGLVVIANDDIPSQAAIIDKCGSCFAVSWDSVSIREGFKRLLTVDSQLPELRKQSYTYALNCATYEPEYIEFKRDMMI